MFKHKQTGAVIEALQHYEGAGEFATDYPSWLTNAYADGLVYFDGNSTKIRTSDEGDNDLVVPHGAWIAYRDGELLPISDAEFLAKYEAVE